MPNNAFRSVSRKGNKTVMRITNNKRPGPFSTLMPFAKRLRAFVLIFALVASPVAVAADPGGIVLLHGKQGSASSPQLKQLVSALMREGFLVNTPEMPWSGGRIYDQTYEAAMEEIDAAVQELRERGAKKIFVGGHSLGANAALYYATRTSLAGVLALAPGHRPDSRLFQKKLAASVERAKSMIQAGKGDERASFDDINQGKSLTVQTTAKIYLSYMDPEGAAVMPKSATAIKPGIPLLWVVGTYDGIYKLGPTYAFDKAPPHPHNKYVVVTSDHRNTPRDATSEIIAWLNALQNP